MSLLDLLVQEQRATTADGWELRLERTICPERFAPSRRPLLIVPGYGMNSFIFGYHPRGTSMTRCLAEGGFEVWSLDLRGQGSSRRLGAGHEPITLEGYAKQDLPAAIARVLDHTTTSARDLVLVGASLGGSIAFAYLACSVAAPVAGLVALGAPLRWVEVHPLLRALFASSWVAGSLRLSGTRTWIRRLLPLLQRAPWLLSMYANTATIDAEHLPEMTATVEDPQPEVNRQLALWIRERDLVLCGKNVTLAMRDVKVPLLVVLSNRDGIVPEPTALSVVDFWGGAAEVLRIGDAEDWYAHANLFVGNDAPSKVFAPLIAWIERAVI
jgi:pimeloyl-ACP methyl ester carboxylesterase